MSLFIDRAGDSDEEFAFREQLTLDLRKIIERKFQQKVNDEGWHPSKAAACILLSLEHICGEAIRIIIDNAHANDNYEFDSSRDCYDQLHQCLQDIINKNIAHLSQDN